MKRLLSTALILLVIATAITWTTAASQPAVARTLSHPAQSLRPAQSLQSDSAVLLSNRFRRYRFYVGYSRYRRAGIARGESCPQNLIASITPVATELPTSVSTYLGTSAHPTFFVGVPQLPRTRLKLTLQPIEAAEIETDLSVENEQTRYRTLDYEKVIYEAEYVLEQQNGGIVGLRTPRTAPPLEVGTHYLWQVSAFCEPNGPNPMTHDDSMILDGGVLRRVADGMNSSTGDRLAYYLDQGIWQEALTIVAKNYYQAPTDSLAAQDWAELMETVGLEDYKAQPIITIQEGMLLPTEY